MKEDGNETDSSKPDAETKKETEAEGAGSGGEEKNDAGKGQENATEAKKDEDTEVTNLIIVPRQYMVASGVDSHYSFCDRALTCTYSKQFMKMCVQRLFMELI